MQRLPQHVGAPIRRLYPSTSAAKIATNLRSVSIGFAKIRPLIRLAAYRGTMWHDTSKIEVNPGAGQSVHVRVGHSRHFDHAPLTSGLPRLADILKGSRHVSKVPNGGMGQNSPAKVRRNERQHSAQSIK
jgi:hypothetical protein